MQLHLSTWPEVGRYLETSSGILMPIGSTEQHGPNGLVGTDAICAEVIARSVGEKTGALVGPTISVGMAHHHMGFPGSMTLKPSTLIAVMRDYVVSLATHGFRRFFFVNGHGGNTSTIQAAFYEIYEELRRSHGASSAEIRCTGVNWWEHDSVRQLSRELYGGKDGMHATISEVSVTQYAYPEAIKTADITPEVAPVASFTDWRDYRAKFPDGRIGSAPQYASPEAGKRFHDAAVAWISAAYARFTA